MAKIWPFSGNNDVDNNVNNYGNNNHRRYYKKPVFYAYLIGLITVLSCLGYLIVAVILDQPGADSIPYTFQVDFLEVTSMTFSRPNNSILTSNQYFSLTINTKDAQLFRPLKVTIEYDRHLISNTTIAPFHQDAVSIKTIPVQMGTADTQLPDKVIDSISTKLASDGVLDFTIKFRGDSWQAGNDGESGHTCHMKMVCKGVAVTFWSTNNTWNGSTKDGPFFCKYSSSNCD